MSSGVRHEGSKTAEVDLVSLLSLIGAAADDHVLHVLRGHGLHDLRVSHGYVIQRLLDGPRTATQIASELGVSQQAVSKSVLDLTAAGYLSRVSDPRDRRRRPLELTPRGQDAVRLARQTRAALGERLARRVSGEDLERTRVVLLAALDVLGIADAVTRRRVRGPSLANHDHP